MPTNIKSHSIAGNSDLSDKLTEHARLASQVLSNHVRLKFLGINRKFDVFLKFEFYVRLEIKSSIAFSLD